MAYSKEAPITCFECKCAICRSAEKLPNQSCCLFELGVGKCEYRNLFGCISLVRDFVDDSFLRRFCLRVVGTNHAKICCYHHIRMQMAKYKKGLPEHRFLPRPSRELIKRYAEKRFLAPPSETFGPYMNRVSGELFLAQGEDVWERDLQMLVDMYTSAEVSSTTL